MATHHKSLSDYDKASVPSAGGLKFGIVVSEWNEEITQPMQQAALATLKEHGADPNQIIIKHVPGSFELPQGAQFLLENQDLDAVICIGSIIQGETRHFEFICQAVANGVMDVALRYNKPVIFGVLTDDNMQQARDRSGGKHGNKGTEAAVAAIKMAALQKGLEN